MLHEGDTILARFELIERLGSGSARASTWRVAPSGPSDQGGVLKLAPPNTAEADDIAREAALLASISHDEARAAQVAPLLQHGQDERWAWLLQEDVGSVDLDRHWAREGIEWRSVLEVGQAVAGALACLHAHGVLHRDVKEQNIVVAPGEGPERYWLVDLGIGRRLDHRSAVTMDLRGSHDRIPPEALSAGRRVGPPGDVFVLCKLLSQALLGSENDAWPEGERAQLEACGFDADNRAQVALVSLLDRGMDMNPRRRPRAAKLARRFAAIRAGKLSALYQRWWFPVATFATGGLLVGAVAAWPESMEPPSVAFEDASAAWGIDSPAPDAMVPEEGWPSTSGFFTYPSLLRDERGPLLYLPRSGRVWTEIPTPLQRDLQARLDGGPLTWEIADTSFAAGRTTLLTQGGFAGHGTRGLLLVEAGEDWQQRGSLLLGEQGTVALGRIRGLLPVPTAGGTGLVGVAPPWLEPAAAERWLERWGDDAIDGTPLMWIDIEEDGEIELLVLHERARLGLLRWEDGAWQREELGELRPFRDGSGLPRVNHVVMDLDADGDDDVAIGDALTREIVIFENTGKSLLRLRVPGLEVLDEGEEVVQWLQAVAATDLDGDGLPELVLPSGGFESKGAQRAKIWRNLGDLSFERISLPATLERPHDSSAMLVYDMDADGRPDLLDFAGNDDGRERPDHRLWRNTGQGEHRQWALELQLQDDEPAPYGTRVVTTGSPGWSRVIRGDGPLYAPDWIAGSLLATLPDGRVLTARLPDRIHGPLRLELEASELPPLYGMQEGRLGPDSTIIPRERLYYHARGTGWELELGTSGGEGTISLRRGEDSTTVPFEAYDEGLGCHGGRCLFLGLRDGGGYQPVAFHPLEARLEPLGIEADMNQAAVSAHGRAWSSSVHNLWERDPESYAEVGEGGPTDPRLDCQGLAFDGQGLACCSRDPQRLTVYDPDALVARWSVELASSGSSCDVLPAGAGWLVAEEQGLAWIGEGGQIERSWLGGSPGLVADGERVWAILPHSALLVDPLDTQVVGGFALGGLSTVMPTPEHGEQGNH